jgi:hypothetical protein
MWTIKRVYTACDEDGEVWDLLYNDGGYNKSIGHITAGKEEADLICQTLNKNLIKVQVY